MPLASVDDHHVAVLLMMGEAIGTFVCMSGWGSDLGAPALLWARVGSPALRQCEECAVPGLWEAFDAIVAR